MAVVMALDLSIVSTGVCVGREGSKDPSIAGTDLEVLGLYAIPTKDGSDGARFNLIVKRIMDDYEKNKCEFMAIEELNVARNLSVVRKLGGLRGAVLYEYHRRFGSDPIMLGPSEIRKALGLKGNADKIQVRRFLEQKGLVCRNTDESDAVACFVAFANLTRRDNART